MHVPEALMKVPEVIRQVPKVKMQVHGNNDTGDTVCPRRDILWPVD